MLVSEPKLSISEGKSDEVQPALDLGSVAVPSIVTPCLRVQCGCLGHNFMNFQHIMLQILTNLNEQVIVFVQMSNDVISIAKLVGTVVNTVDRTLKIQEAYLFHLSQCRDHPFLIRQLLHRFLKPVKLLRFTFL